MVDVTASQIEATLLQVLDAAPLHVIDESHQHAGHVGANDTGFGTHFRVKLDSPQFYVNNKKISRVAQHRLVYAALDPYFKAGLHALAIESI